MSDHAPTRQDDSAQATTPATALGSEPAEPGKKPPALSSVREVLESTLRINEGVHQTIMDYALIVAIVALPPTVPWLQEIQLGAVLVINLLLVRSIGAQWGFPRGHGPLARILLVLGLLGAIITMLVAYLVVYAIGLYVPFMLGWSKAAGGFALTLGVGRTANDFYLSARRIDPKRIHLVLLRQRRSKRLRALGIDDEQQGDDR